MVQPKKDNNNKKKKPGDKFYLNKIVKKKTAYVQIEWRKTSNS